MPRKRSRVRISSPAPFFVCANLAIPGLRRQRMGFRRLYFSLIIRPDISAPNPRRSLSAVHIPLYRGYRSSTTERGPVNHLRQTAASVRCDHVEPLEWVARYMYALRIGERKSLVNRNKNRESSPATEKNSALLSRSNWI